MQTKEWLRRSGDVKPRPRQSAGCKLINSERHSPAIMRADLMEKWALSCSVCRRVHVKASPEYGYVTVCFTGNDFNSSRSRKWDGYSLYRWKDDTEIVGWEAGNSKRDTIIELNSSAEFTALWLSPGSSG